MGNKTFYGLLAGVFVAFLAVVLVNQEPAKPRPGTEHQDNGRQHVASKDYDTEEPPTSGDHTEPLPWQIYAQEIPDSNVIHNMEHGGIYISYRPDLPKEQVDKIEALFSKPYSNPDFSPSKAVVAPRSNNKSPIVMSSWLRSQTFESFDETKMIEYYLENVGKSPESGAG